MAKRKSGALKTAKIPPPSPFRKNENTDKANVDFGDLEFEAAIQEYVKDSPVALLALQDINKRGGISKFLRALQYGDESYATTTRGEFFPEDGERMVYNATDVLSFLNDKVKGNQPHPIYGEYRPSKEKVKAAQTVQKSLPVIAHELFHYGTNVLRKQGYNVPKGFMGRKRGTGDKRISADILNEEAIIDFLEKTQRKRMGVKEEDYNKAAELINISLRAGDDRSKRPLLGRFKSTSGYEPEESPFAVLKDGKYKYTESPDQALTRFEGMALEELKKRNYARTKEPLKDTREKSFLEKLSRLNPFREKERPMYREGGAVNMLKKNK